MLERRVFATGGVILDDRWFPVVIMTWWGELGLDVIESYFAWYDDQVARARSEGRKFAIISDGLDVRRPNAEARKRLAIESRAREAAMQECVASTYVVVHGALLLGVLASVISVFRSGLRISSTSDMATAIERTLARLDQAGVPRPAGLDPATYVRPSRTEE